MQLVTKQCQLCLKNNPKTKSRNQIGTIVKGNYPGSQWQIDFSELPRKGGYRYLLLLTDTFSGWPEAFPYRANNAKQVIKVLLNEIIPSLGLPTTISSDCSTHFSAKLLQEIGKELEIDWQ